MLSICYTLNHDKIVKHPERITKFKPLMDKCDWERINYPSEKNDWKKFEKNNLTIALNVLYAKKEKKTYSAYVSKHNSNREKQVIFLMIINREGWHYPELKIQSAFSIGITSKHKKDFRTKNKLE